MSAVLRAPAGSLAAVHERAQRCCLAFVDEPLPPGCSRPTARVGIEVDPHTGHALLHVEHGIDYAGPSEDVRAWLATGSCAFDSFDQLESWVAGPLDAAYATNTAEVAGTAEPGDCRTIATESSTVPATVLVDTGRFTELLAEEVVGQDRAIGQIVEATALHLARCAPRRPLTIAAFGPTGTGKTLMAETLAKAVTRIISEPCEFLRLDMSEFQERHSVAKLLGAPPGYIGYGETGSLVEVLRRCRRAVVIFDEFEKAHPDVFRAVMNLMDAGRLAPASGGSLDARHAVFILTSNQGAAQLAEALSTDSVRYDDQVARDALVREMMRRTQTAPELVGRLHTLLVFDALSDEHLDEVLRRTIRREAATFGLTVNDVDPRVLEHLRQRRPDQASGVRAWEYLVASEIGPAFLAGVTAQIQGPCGLMADPVRLEQIPNGKAS